eukprot:snap_masked-scaffold_3-processed-gene-21.65-mRNA-1 protein AED:1.00 eAED:1.00 QI:0/0/0/0/1/1/2/0/59
MAPLLVQERSEFLTRFLRKEKKTVEIVNVIYIDENLAKMFHRERKRNLTQTHRWLQKLN